MSIAAEITRIQLARNDIREKLATMGLVTPSSNISECAEAVENIENCGAVSVSIKEEEVYTIPKGYHNGSGKVTGVAGGGNYSLQPKTVTPTKKAQSVKADSGYYGLSGVTVSAIPEAYQDVTPVTAAAADVLAKKTIVDATGAVVAGTMTDNGAVSKTLNTTTKSYTIPKGYHDGTGSVSITTETKSVTPTKSIQTIAPTSGKVLSAVSVAAIPDEYIITTSADATEADILDGKTAYVDGVKVKGSMANNGSISGSFNALSATTYAIPAGYTSGGTITLTDDLETALAAI